MSPAEIVDELTYRSYRHNRLMGCGTSLASLFADGDALERRFQAEQEDEAKRLDAAYQREMERRAGCFEEDNDGAD